MAFRLPNDTQQLLIYGQNGSGKTVAGLWHLVMRDFLKRPWLIIDSKRDPTIKRIPRLEEVRHDQPPPKQPGLYVTRPKPGDDLDPLLWCIWEREKTGVFVDEGYRIDRFSDAFTALLTTGRSKRIPIITLTQRPTWLNPFVMSEAAFHQVFFLTNPADVKRMREFVPGLREMRKDYHSQYYDVAQHETTILAPVPNENEILSRFDDKMPRRVRVFRGLLENAPASRKRRRT